MKNTFLRTLIFVFGTALLLSSLACKHEVPEVKKFDFETRPRYQTTVAWVEPGENTVEISDLPQPVQSVLFGGRAAGGRAASGRGIDDAKQCLQLVASARDKQNNNYYTIYMGRVDYVPIESHIAVEYNGVTPQKISFPLQQSVSNTVTKSAIKCVEESVFKKDIQALLQRSVTSELEEKLQEMQIKVAQMKIQRAQVVAGIKLGFLEKLTAQNKAMTEKVSQIKEEFVEAKFMGKEIISAAQVVQDINEVVVNKGISLTDGMTDVLETTGSSSTDTIEMVIGNNNEPRGKYRYTLFMSTDVYCTIKLSPDKTEVLEAEIEVCANENHYYGIDYDPDLQGNFKRRANSELLQLPDDISKLPDLFKS